MTQYLDRSAWTNYFNEFTRRNQLRPTQLEVFGENGAQQQERGLPFTGISLGRGNGAPEVEIMLGEPDSGEARRLTHVITNVEQITAKRGADGRDEALQIVSEGETSLLSFDPRPVIN
jgi:hypothetical protein